MIISKQNVKSFSIKILSYVSLINRYFQDLIHAKSQKKQLFKLRIKKSPVKILRFLHNKKFTCANLAVFAQ